MNITSTQFKPSSVVARPKAADQKPASNESHVFGVDTKDNIAIGITAVTTVGAATFAGMKVAEAVPVGMILPPMSGITGALAGVAIGAVSGGATCYGINMANEILDTKHSHPPIMRLAATTFGGLVGGIAGGVAGYFGAEALIVAPVAVGAGTAGMVGAMYATDAWGLGS